MKTRLLVALGLLIFTSGLLLADGHWEFNVHYSRWTLNVVKGLVENMVSDALESDLKDRFLQQIQADHPGLVESGYSQTVVFDAPGYNLGFEVRYYPGGQKGAFSLGLAVEQSNMKISFPEISANLDLTDTSSSQTAHFTAQAGGEFLIKPLSFHLNMRWDLLPTKVVSPYFCLGAGVSTGKSFLDAKYSYHYTGRLDLPDGSSENYSDSETKTLRQIKEENLAEGKSWPLNFVPILQLNFGLRFRLTPNLRLVLDAGIFDGFLFRGGVSFRI
jgi:opacity protein-like surface antigen